MRNRRVCRGRKAALDVVVEGLRRLEYRGYDSAGVAIVADETLYVAKKAGKIGNLEKPLAEEPLPRTRRRHRSHPWATHGGPNDVNAHPHVSADGRIALVHNGIIENYVDAAGRARGGRHPVRLRNRHRDRRTPAGPAGHGRGAAC